MEKQPLKIFCRGCHLKLDVSDCEPFSRISCPMCGTSLLVPRRFGRYLLEKVCGTGGSSRIYRAIDPQLARRVAVKLLSPELSEEFRRRFLDEAKLVSRVEHRGIIPIYDCGEEAGETFLVMQFMSGGDLERLYVKRKLIPAPKEAVGMILRIAEALEALHAQGIVHHDVKCSNIMLSAEQEPKLGDFDLADLRAADDFTTPCLEWASPGYASPERLYHGGESFAGDVFSLGVTLYELLSGQLPFGLADNAELLYERRQNMEFRALPDLNPAVPRELGNLIFSMLQFLPEERPDAAAVVRFLQKLA